MNSSTRDSVLHAVPLFLTAINILSVFIESFICKPIRLASLNILMNQSKIVAAAYTGFGISGPFSGKEEKSKLEHFETAATSHLLAIAAKELPLGVLGYPENWKFHLSSWVEKNTTAEDVLNRFDIKTPKSFFSTLIARATSSSTIYDASFHRFLGKISQHESMDKHMTTCYNHFDKFFDKSMRADLEAKVSELYVIQDLLDEAVMTRSQDGRELRQRFIDRRVAQISSIIAVVKEEFIEKMLCTIAQGMIAADPSLFRCLEPNQIPINANSHDLSEWFQVRILDAKNAKIAFRTSATNPLQVIPKESVKSSERIETPTLMLQNRQERRQGYVANINNNNNNNGYQHKNNNNINSPRPQNVVQQRGGAPPSNGQPGKQPYQAPSHQATNGQPPSKKVRRHCNWCAANFPTFKWNIQTHNQEDCYRDTAGKYYDAAKAAYPPKK